MNQYQELLDLLEGSKSDFEKFYEKGNDAAGTRVRATMQKLKEAAQEVRVSVIGIREVRLADKFFTKK
jgi:hypothetical protein